MVARLKWEVPNGDPLSRAKVNKELDRRMILDLLDHNAFTIHYQPIFSAHDGCVYGYEALTRLRDGFGDVNIGELFKKAILTNTISSLDVHCRTNAIAQASSLGINQQNAHLFINVCPETLTDPAHNVGITDELAEKWNIPKEKIILEITEESAIHNYNLFKESIAYYRERGYKIAIDDFGAGHGGLKMLSIIEPDFVKIDRHFISSIDKAIIKYNLVDSIATACHRMGIKVIAEGIERNEELETVLNMGIELLQGFYLHRPSPMLNGDKAMIPVLHSRKQNGLHTRGEQSFIGDIAHEVDPISSSATVMAAFNRFIKNSDLRGLPVVDDGCVLGMLHRIRFLENQVLGKFGYGLSLNSYKSVSQLMEQQLLMVEANTTLEEVAQRISSRKSEYLYDDICITRNGKYFGTVAISSLLDAIAERSLALAKGANPLTGLPGNEFIQREIDKKLLQNMHFDVCYIDINNFKPFNDHYGFEKGDGVIRALGNIAETTVTSFESGSFNFVGHIGGDDFIVITRPQISMAVCERIVSRFEAQLVDFHGTEDCGRGSYLSRNRKNEEEKFRLLSLSIGIVSTEVHKIESYAQLASIATEVKKAAKMKEGSSIVRDRRLMG
ncbi:MAG TPA: EAL domain-containing protein [Dissulfurispiraceae bacterium]